MSPVAPVARLVHVDVRGAFQWRAGARANTTLLTPADAFSINTLEAPNTVTPTYGSLELPAAGSALELELPAHALMVLSIPTV